MPLSKKNYQAIADILMNADPEIQLIGVVLDLAQYFKKDNPRFDAERFIDASGFKIPSVILQERELI